MQKLILMLTILGVAIQLSLPGPAIAQDNENAVVRAVLFYSPSCPHCHQVITELLVPMIEEYGPRLEILGVDTTNPRGGQLYQNAIEQFQIPQERRGVPTLIVGETVLVGSGEIPEKFPAMVQNLLAGNGIDWPAIPGFVPEQAATPPAPTVTLPAQTPTPKIALVSPAQTLTPPPERTTETISGLVPANPVAAAPPADPVGMATAFAVLLGMALALVFTLWRVSRRFTHLVKGSDDTLALAKGWAIPALSFVGLVVAGYLAYVEITSVEAVCGPVGNCNLVQSSAYTQIMGIPIAVLGLVNYVGVVGLWLVQKYGREPLPHSAAVGLLGLTIFGTIFSVYLTLLEIFVIHAVCTWCLTSALITTMLMLLVVKPVTDSPSVRSLALL